MIKVFVATVLFLLACNVGVLWLYGRKAKEQQLVIESLLPYMDRVNTLSGNLLRNVRNAGEVVSDSAMLTGSQGETMTLGSVVEGLGDYVLVVRFSERHCQSCVAYAISLMKEVESDTTLRVPVIYVGDISNKLLFKEQVEGLGLDVENDEVYNCSDLGTECLEYEGFPYYILIDGDRKIKMCYFPTKGMGGFDKDAIIKACKHAILPPCGSGFAD